MEHRIKKIFELSETKVDEVKELKDGLDVIVFMNAVMPNTDQSFFYVTGLFDGIFEMSSSVLFPDGGAHVISPVLEETTARKSEFDLTLFQKYEDIDDVFKKLFKGATAVGINADELTHANFLRIKNCCGPDTKLINVGPAVKAARIVKDAEELGRLEKACTIVSRVAENITDKLEEGVKEYEVGAELSYGMQKMGATNTSFVLVAFGEMTAEPHYIGGSRKLEKDQLIILDFGAEYLRYHSDITRTYYKGSISDKARKIHECVRKAQKVALENIRPGVNAREVHEKVFEYIESTEFKGYFPHATGHTLGLSVHDGERLYNRDLTLEENMVFTVEPGIYIPGYGGVRVEDDIVVTKDGYRFLTDATRELVEV